MRKPKANKYLTESGWILIRTWRMTERFAVGDEFTDDETGEHWRVVDVWSPEDSKGRHIVEAVELRPDVSEKSLRHAYVQMRGLEYLETQINTIVDFDNDRCAWPGCHAPQINCCTGCAQRFCAHHLYPNCTECRGTSLCWRCGDPRGLTEAEINAERRAEIEYLQAEWRAELLDEREDPPGDPCYRAFLENQMQGLGVEPRCL